MRNQNVRVFFIVTLSLVATSFIGCSTESKAQFSQLSSSILNAAGVNVSNSQVNNFITAGESINKATRGLSDEQEYYLGRAVSASILKQYPLKSDPQATRYLNKVGRVLAAYSPRPETFNGYRFAILKGSEVNAISAPAGFVFVTEGFLSQINDEDSLAAVLAHEIAHVALGHGTAAISQANITSALSLLGKDAVSYSGNSIAQQLVEPLGDSVSDIVETLLTKGYSRSQEYEADLLAVEILSKAGYQEAAMNTVLSGLAKNSSEGGGWTDTHPKPDKRLSELEDERPIAALQAENQGYKIRKARFLKAFRR